MSARARRASVVLCGCVTLCALLSGGVARAALLHAQDAVVAAATPEAASAQLPATLDQAALAAELARLAQSYSALASVTSLARTSGGRDVWLLTLGDTRAGDPREHPALFVCVDDHTADGARLRAALGACEQLLARATNEPELRGLLERATLYFVPTLAPDRLAPALADASSGRTDPARDFPIDWLPSAVAAERVGPYPLSLPETHALARFLQAQTNVGLALLCGQGAQATVANASAPAVADVGVPIASAARGPGSLAAFCEGLLGIPCCAERAPDQDLSRLFEQLLHGLPQLALGAPSVERLRANLWMIDVPIENHGRCASASTRAADAGAVHSWLQVGGGRLVAAACKRADATAFDALESRPERTVVELLGAGERRVLRVLVDAAENSTLELALDSLRAGHARVSVTLPASATR